MLTIKGFVTRTTYIDNAPNNIATIGEISTYALTYSKDVQIHKSPSVPKSDLYIFTYRDEVQELESDSNISEIILNIGSYIFGYAENNPVYAIGVLESDLLASFPGSLINIDSGPFVTYQNAMVPAWISFTIPDVLTSEVRIWFSDPSFRDQYDEHQITVVPPVESIDTMMENYTFALQQIASTTDTAKMERIQTALGTDPSTIVKTVEFDYIDPNLDTTINPSNWTLIIYGKQGDFPDTIKRAIVEYLTENSGYPISDWIPILPGIFSDTQFYITPVWTDPALSGLVGFDIAYKSISGVADVEAYVNSQIPFVTTNNNYLSILPSNYKFLQLYIAGSDNNVAGKQKIEDIYSDYIYAASTSVDFNRMSQSTQSWVQLLEEGLIIAESITNVIVPTAPYRTSTIGGKLFVIFSYDNVDYYILAKVDAT